jgi:hypothetical protein
LLRIRHSIDVGLGSRRVALLRAVVYTRLRHRTSALGANANRGARRARSRHTSDIACLLTPWAKG